MGRCDAQSPRRAERLLDVELSSGGERLATRYTQFGTLDSELERSVAPNYRSLWKQVLVEL
jgi:hypothetical protein